MSGYRRVNYYELCRLCTSSEGTKMHIFREEGRRRQLPSKIQMCLPLQVSEDDSLPKIVCSHCVDKLDTMFEFRNSCVTAEAMLESYFTSLRYSEDFIREGKVYVKDESPKKKNQLEAEKAAIKVPNVQTIASIPVSMDGLNNLVQAATIQIVNHSDNELIRQPQYKCVEVPMSTSGTESNVRFTYQTCTSSATHTTPTVTLIKSDEHSQPEKSVSTQNHPTINQGPSYYLRLPTNVESGNGEQQELGQVVGDEQLHQAMVFAPNHGQEVLVFDLNKEKDQNNEATILRTDDRTSIAQIGEFLRMKTAVVVEDEEEQNTIMEHDTVRCDQCGKELDSAEEQANHELTCPGAMVDNKSGGGNFSCDMCGKLFKRKEHLFQHSKLHSGERPFLCTICSKAFSRKEHLVRHSVSHTGQKSYACDLCTKSFSRKDNLHKHRKTHGVAGPYVCETCGKSFVVKHYYLMHKTTHAPSDSPDSLPFRCDICYRGFSTKSHMISHKQRHRGRAGQVPEEPEEDPLATSTVNAAAILPPNVMHSGPTGTPLFHVSTGTNTTTYLTTAVVDNYRRLHPS